MFTVDIEGAKELKERFAALPQAIRAALAQKFASLAQELHDKIANEKLDGAALLSRSGRLRQSILASLGLDGASLSADGVAYAAAHEYGFHGDESVAAHSRTIKEAFGRAITPKTILVQAFSRHMNLPERSFMRSSLDEMQDKIAQTLREAVEGEF